MSVWIDIKFAPRDGTKVDLWWPPMGRQVDCWWDDGLWVFDASALRRSPQWAPTEPAKATYNASQPTHFKPIGPGPNVDDPKTFDWAALARLRKTEGEY